MLRHLTSKIKSTGPVTVAEYMREVLTNPVTVSNHQSGQCRLRALTCSQFMCPHVFDFIGVTLKHR